LPAGAELPGLDEVLAVAGGVASAFEAAGYRLYLVGGVVRDLMLGELAGAEDIDLTTDARPAAIKGLVSPLASAMWSPGERFGTVAATVNGRHLEITTHRAESYDPASRKPIVTFGDSITEDLARRDFTINAMAVSLPDRQLHDPHGGLTDLADGVLRTPLRPELAFGDDPLRMLRAARFLPRFDLRPEPELEAAAAAMAGRLSIVSAERIRDELERLLSVDAPHNGLGFLRRTGLLGRVVSGLADRLEAQGEACAAASGPGSLLARRAGLLAPVAPAATADLRRLRYDRHTIKATAALLAVIDTVLRPPDAGGGAGPGSPAAVSVPAETVRRVVDRIGLDRVGDLRQLAENLTRYREPDAGLEPAGLGLPFFDRFDQLVLAEDLSQLASPLSGREVMAHLDLAPGPLVGEAINHLRQRRLSDGPLSAQTAYDLLEQWWRQARTGADGKSRRNSG
jgi:poly(A) polymerase